MTNPIRIALIMQGSRDWIGGLQYIKNIILALRNLPAEAQQAFELYLVCRNDLDANSVNQIKPYVKKILYYETDIEPLTFTGRIRKRILKSIFKKSLSPFDLFLQNNTFNFVYPYLSKNTKQKAFRSAAWIPDFQHRYLPQFFEKKEVVKRDKVFTKIARHASTIVLSSKATEADFLNFFPDASSKTKVLPFKIFPISSWYKEDPKRIQKKYHLPDKFFLISNQFWQHKNHLAAFEALKLIYEKSIYPDIVCTGHLYDQRQPDYADTILQAIHELGIAKQVHLLGLIPKSEQIQLVRRAIAIIQPSFFEGWSTVVEEAKCFGKSIILSDLPVNREQNPPNSLFFKPESSEQLADLIATSWERLNPGPDFEQEMNAKKNYLNKVNDFAYDFIEIARGA